MPRALQAVPIDYQEFDDCVWDGNRIEAEKTLLFHEHINGMNKPGKVEIDLLQHYRNRQVADGYLACDEIGRYFLTEKGKTMVRKELKRYELRPGMIMLIEQHILEANDVAVY